MSYFVLPQVPFDINIHKRINPTYSVSIVSTPEINRTLYKYLSDIKTKIDGKDNLWDRYKKYTNPYEYIHTVVPGCKTSVCKIKPVSRSFFKMIEIMKTMRLIDDKENNIKSFHLAEGPGGFIEAIAMTRNNENDKYYGMTLLNDNDFSVPGWKKSQMLLNKHPNIEIEAGKSGTGDLMDPENLKYCFKKYSNSCDLVTADGGFDFTTNFNNQEAMSSKLILCQVAFAIACQKKGGHFFIKVFDTFTQFSLDMLYLLSCLYKQVSYLKPHTSRSANSEKYIVCKGFKMENSRNLVISLYHLIQNFSETNYLNRIFRESIPHIFVTRVEEYNAIYGQIQMECISHTLSIMRNINNDKLENMNKNNVQKCISWCQKHKMPFVKNALEPNRFMTRANKFVSENKEETQKNKKYTV